MHAFDKVVIAVIGALASAAVPKMAAACSPGYDSNGKFYPAIYNNWSAYSGYLGSAVTCVTPDGVLNGGHYGSYQAFQFGTSDWDGNPSASAFEVDSHIAGKWNASGGAYSYGQPTSNRSGIPYEVSGLMNTFYYAPDGSTRYLVWNNGSDGPDCNDPDGYQVCAVYGAIGQYWYDTLEFAYENAAGLPTSEEFPTPDGIHHRQNFTKLYVTFNFNNGSLCSFFPSGTQYSGTGPC